MILLDPNFDNHLLSTRSLWLWLPQQINMIIFSVGVVQCIDIAMFTGGHHTARITEVVMWSNRIIKTLLSTKKYEIIKHKTKYDILSYLTRLTQQMAAQLGRVPRYKKRCSLDVTKYLSKERIDKVHIRSIIPGFTFTDCPEEYASRSKNVFPSKLDIAQSKSNC